MNEIKTYRYTYIKKTSERCPLNKCFHVQIYIHLIRTEPLPEKKCSSIYTQYHEKETQIKIQYHEKETQINFLCKKICITPKRKETE